MADKVLRPNLTLRIYHDARQAEVLNSSQQDLEKMERGMSDAALLYRWKTNRFLYKWLNYCRRQGHGFDSASSVDSANNRLLVDGVLG
jgi:uncharacterized protein YqiB (DUF1249 family)